MNTVEGNKIIAESQFASDEIKDKWTIANHHGALLGAFYKGLKYHESYDWLMGIVENIEAYGFSTNIDSDMRDQVSDEYFCGILAKGCVGTFVTKRYSNSSKIEAIWKACIAFIEWYNKNQTK